MLKSSKLPRILLVEDNKQMRRLTEEVLGADGYLVESVGDGLAALDCIAARRPDLVLSDGRMPHMDGWALCAEIRRRWPAPHLNFVLFSAGENDDFERGWREAGVDAHLGKPFRSAELLRVIARILRAADLCARTPRA